MFITIAYFIYSWIYTYFFYNTIDVQPPSIQCPPNQELSTETGQSYAIVTWEVPVPSDNSNVSLSLKGLRPPQQFYVGRHYVRYEVTDTAELSTSCTFSIDVKGAYFLLCFELHFNRCSIASYHLWLEYIEGLNGLTSRRKKWHILTIRRHNFFLLITIGNNQPKDDQNLTFSCKSNRPIETLQ